MDRISSYYLRKNEDERLLSGRGELEFLRTKQIIQQRLPAETELAIADIGGGTGPYSFWLAELGYEVSLFDLVPHHIEQAYARNEKASHRLAHMEVADARKLDLEPNGFDAILLLGPMYHLTEQPDRIEVLRKVGDSLSDGGVAFVAYISRFASMCDGFIRRLFEDPEYVDIVRSDLATGVHEPDASNSRYFTDAYFHHPDEIEQELTAAGLKIEDHVAVEGVGWLWQNFDELWADPEQRAIMLEMIERTDRDRSLLGAGAHNIVVVRKSAKDVQSDS